MKLLADLYAERGGSIRCIERGPGKTWCGYGFQELFVFRDCNHALMLVELGKFRVCPECCQGLMQALLRNVSEKERAD